MPRPNLLHLLHISKPSIDKQIDLLQFLHIILFISKEMMDFIFEVGLGMKIFLHSFILLARRINVFTPLLLDRKAIKMLWMFSVE
jgi:hypothetical protein